MILGLSIHEFTVLHVIISLLGIASGFYVAMRGLLQGRVIRVGTWIFLGTTILTSLSYRISIGSHPQGRSRVSFWPRAFCWSPLSGWVFGRPDTSGQ
jgi:hypothetical protein